MKDTREGRRKPVSSHGTVERAQVDLAIAFDRTNAEGGTLLLAQVEIPIAKELGPRRPAVGGIFEGEAAPAATIGAAVGDKSRVSSGWIVDQESTRGPGRAGNSRAFIDNGALIGSGARIQEVGPASDPSADARPRL